MGTPSFASRLQGGHIAAVPSPFNLFNRAGNHHFFAQGAKVQRFLLNFAVIVMDFQSLLICTLLLVVAMGLVGLIFGQTERKPATTRVVAMAITPGSPDDDSTHVSLTALPHGQLLVSHSGLLLATGETVHLVVTTRGHTMLLKERKGSSVAGGKQSPCTATATVPGVPQAVSRLRYESEVTGQWAMASMTWAEGQPKTVELRY